MSKASVKAAERAEAVADLHKFLKPGQTVYTVLRKVSASGTSRQMDVYTIYEGRMVYLSGYVAKAADERRNAAGALVVSGCGMDVGFHVVYNLGRVMWPNGTPEPHGRRNGEPDSDGGYALKHEWL